MQTSSRNWQEIIWREWRHSNDLEYAELLFDLVADEPIGWRSGLSFILLNAIAGAALGILIIAPLTFEWEILRQLALAGAVVGAARAFLVSRRLIWREWLPRLESNTPTSSLSRVIAGVLLLALVGGMLFGPVFWLMMAGLFWAIGGVITWLRSSLQDSGSFSPEDRRWWFWWQNRQPLIDLQVALQQACAASPAAREIWADPLHRLAERKRQPASAEELIRNLLSNDWVERFIARHTLITLGQEAVFPLQTIATRDQTPLGHTARWLLQNIEQSSTAS